MTNKMSEGNLLREVRILLLSEPMLQNERLAMVAKIEEYLHQKDKKGIEEVQKSISSPQISFVPPEEVLVSSPSISPYSLPSQLHLVSECDDLFLSTAATGISEKRVVGVIDFFLLCYDLGSSCFKYVGLESTVDKSKRKGYAQLVLSPELVPKRLKRTASMTEILCLTDNPPRPSQPIICFNFHGDSDEYVFVFEMFECKGEQKLKCSKFYFVVTDGFCPFRASALAKQLAVKEFQLALQIRHQIQFELSETKKYFQQIVMPCLQRVISGQGQYEEEWKEYVSKAAVPTLSMKDIDLYTKQVPVLLILFFHVLAERKVVLVCSSGQRHLLSELISSLLYCLKPLKYVFPIINASLTTQHLEFIQSPVPMIIAYWGQMHFPFNPSSDAILLNMPQDLITSNNKDPHQDKVLLSMIEDITSKNLKKALKEVVGDILSDKKLHGWRKKLQVIARKSQIYQYHMHPNAKIKQKQQ